MRGIGRVALVLSVVGAVVTKGNRVSRVTVARQGGPLCAKRRQPVLVRQRWWGVQRHWHSHQILVKSTEKKSWERTRGPFFVCVIQLYADLGKINYNDTCGNYKWCAVQKSVVLRKIEV